MRLKRYELLFFGESQHVGIFQGMKDAGIHEQVIDSMCAELPIPPYHTFEQPFEIKAYFTPNGAKKMEDVISFIKFELIKQNNGFEMGECERTLSKEDDIVYSDPFQVLIRIKKFAGDGLN